MPKAIRKAIDRASARYAQRVERMEALSVQFVQDMVAQGSDRLAIIQALSSAEFQQVIMDDFGLAAGAGKILDTFEHGVLGGLTRIGHMTEEMLSAITTSEQASFLRFVEGQAATVQKELVRAVVRDLGPDDMRKALASVVSPTNADTIANTALNTYSRSVNEEMAKTAPKGQKYVYEGPQDDKTRDICLEMGAAGEMTYEEIEAEYPGGFGDGGGFNCRHQWTPEEEVDENNSAKAERIIAEKTKDEKWKKPQTIKERLGGVQATRTAPKAVRLQPATDSKAIKLRFSNLLSLPIKGEAAIRTQHRQRWVQKKGAGVGAFRGVPLDVQNAMLEGTETILERYKVEVYGIKGSSSTSYAGVYEYFPGGDTGVIRVANNILKRSSENHRLYIDHTLTTIKNAQTRLRDLLSRAGTTSRADHLRTLLAQSENTAQWCIATAADVRTTAESVRRIAIHESIHAVDKRYNVSKIFGELLETEGVSYSDWFKVSEYGASEIVELFAEVGTAIEVGVNIPAPFVRSFNEAMKVAGAI